MNETIKVLSAGGVILKKNKKGEVKVLVSQHSAHKGWSFPKGHVETGETPAAAAHREVGEEVGVVGKILGKAGITTYFYYERKKPDLQKNINSKVERVKESRGSKAEGFYFEDGQRIFKTVIYFFMKYEGKVEATMAWEVSAVKWLPIEKIEDRLTFKDDREMWNKARPKIKNLELD